MCQDKHLAGSSKLLDGIQEKYNDHLKTEQCDSKVKKEKNKEGLSRQTEMLIKT